MKIIKLGGELVRENAISKIYEEIARVANKEDIIIVHGGGDEVTEIAEKLGIKQKFIISASGIESRYTDAETVKIYTMVMSGLISRRIAQNLIKFNLRPFCMTGMDGSIVIAERKKRLLIMEGNKKLFIDGGYTGIIKQVNLEPIQVILKLGYIPIISPIAIGEEGEMLNVDSDRMASGIASAFKSEYLIFLTNVDGIYLNGSLIEEISLSKCKEILNSVGQGMKMKLIASISAIENGVKKVIITNGNAEDLNLIEPEKIKKKTLIKND